jgi:hypothetical protein
MCKSLQACVTAIHSWSGCRVIPDTQILRLSKWMKNSTLVVGDRALPGQDFRREEVRRRHNIQVGANEIFPTDGVLPLGCGSSAMAPQNVAHGLV